MSGLVRRMWEMVFPRRDRKGMPGLGKAVKDTLLHGYQDHAAMGTND